MKNSTFPCNSSSADCRFYFHTELFTGICFAILSPITTTSNALLLFTIFKDPLKCFRAPPMYFIIALAFADFTTGLIVEPFLTATRVRRYVYWSHTLDEPYNTLEQIGRNLSYVGLNSSFLFVLGLILAQFIAIAYPHHYRSVVTTRRVLACAGFSLMYFTGFTVLPFFGVAQIIFQVDLYLHSTLITVFLVVGFAMLLRAYRQHAIASHRLGVGSSFSGRTGKSLTNEVNERKFIIVTLLLTGILILCILPNTVVLYVWAYKKQDHDQPDCSDLTSVVFLTELILFVKVSLDAFIYAWRLPRYRRSLKLVITCRSNQVTSEATELRIRGNVAFQQRNLEIVE